MTSTTLRDQAAAALGWWAGELAHVSSAPRVARPWRGMLQRSGEGYEAYLRAGRATQHLGRIDVQADAAAARRIADTLRSKGAIGDALVLRLPAQEVLETQLQLPTAVRDVMGPVVRNKLEVVAPWPADQALHAFEPLTGQPGDQQITVNLWVTGKAPVDEALAELAAIGIAPGVVDAASDLESEPRFNLIGGNDAMADRTSSIVRLLKAGVFSALAMVLAGAGYAFYLGQQHAAQEQAILREMKAATAMAQPQHAEAQRQQAYVIEQRVKAPSISVALEALSRALPDDAYLERIELRNDVMILTGKAFSSADLIGPLEAIRHFERIEFAAPTTRKDGDQREEFSLTVRVKPAMTIDAGRRP